MGWNKQGGRVSWPSRAALRALRMSGMKGRVRTLDDDDETTDGHDTRATGRK